MVRITSDVETAKAYLAKGRPCVLALTKANKDKDLSFARFLVELDKEGLELLEAGRYKELWQILGHDYMHLVEARVTGQPIVIGRQDRLTLRELVLEDYQALYEYFEYEKPPFIEKFFDTKAEAKEYIKTYIEMVYDFYGYGLWAVVDNANGELAGLVGFTPRQVTDDTDGTIGELMDLELGYAIRGRYQRRGYGYEACKLAIDYAKEHIDFNKIIVDIHEHNQPGQGLARKLGII